MKFNRILQFALLCIIPLAAVSGCATYARVSAGDAGNSRTPLEVVHDHLRAVEAGDWDRAGSFLSDSYRMQMKGMPFFVSIPRSSALDVHKARKRAFPDFRFNEKVEWQEGNEVKLAIYLTGTHTGVLEYPPNAGVPRTEPTGKSVDLPAEYFTYAVEKDRIVYTYGEIPEGHGPAALKKQLGIGE